MSVHQKKNRRYTADVFFGCVRHVIPFLGDWGLKFGLRAWARKKKLKGFPTYSPFAPIYKAKTSFKGILSNTV